MKFLAKFMAFYEILELAEYSQLADVLKFQPVFIQNLKNQFFTDVTEFNLLMASCCIISVFL